MKTTRQWLILLLSAVLALSLSAPALAAESEIHPADTAAEFFALLDQEDVEYTDLGYNSKENYEILLTYHGQVREEHEIHLFIDDDGRAFSAYEWYLMEYDPARLPVILETLNELNNEYRFVTFLADTTDNTITAELHGTLGKDAAQSARLMDYGYSYLPLIVDFAWEELEACVLGDGSGKTVSQADYAGTWRFSSMTFTSDSNGQPAGTVLTEEDFGTPDVFVLELMETGEMAVDSFGVHSGGTWAMEGDAVILSDDTGDFTAVLQEDGTLFLDAEEDGGYTMILTREK